MASHAKAMMEEFEKDKDMKGAVKFADSDSLDSIVTYYVDTQVPTLNFSITQNGFPAGRLTTIMGPEGGSKSTLIAHNIAEVQKMGGLALLVDTESRFEPERAAAIGVDTENLLVVQGISAEQVLAVIEKFIETVRVKYPKEMPAMVYLDSVAGLVTQKRLDASASDHMIGEIARFMSNNLGRVHAAAARNQVGLVFTNQYRSRIVADPRPGMTERHKVMGTKKTMVAEAALVYWSSLMIHVEQVGLAGEDRTDPTGIRVRTIIKKCSIGGGEGRQSEYEVDKRTGVNRILAAFELLCDLKLITVGGGWYTLDPVLFPNASKFRRDAFGDIWRSTPALEQVVRKAPELWHSKTATTTTTPESEQPSPESPSTPAPTSTPLTESPSGELLPV